MSAPPRVLVNARAAVRPEPGGVERWTRELVAALRALRPERYGAARPPAALAGRAGHVWEQVLLPLRARSAAVLLGPANLAPVVFPRNVVVMHDAAPLREPAWYTPAYAEYHRRMLPAVARGARRVITGSAFSRAELAELLGVDATVVPGGVDGRFTPRADPDPARVALGLRRPYVLTVAGRTARKNLAALAPAAKRLAAHGIDFVAAGGTRPHCRDGRLPDTLRDVGPVPDRHLPGLYAGARAFVLPSLYEGFGLTCLEAMACGTPVVAARAGALPETCGGAARLVDPHDPDGIADAVERVLDDPGLRAAGLRRAAQFTWERTARMVDDEISALLRRAPRA